MNCVAYQEEFISMYLVGNSLIIYYSVIMKLSLKVLYLKYWTIISWYFHCLILKIILLIFVIHLYYSFCNDYASIIWVWFSIWTGKHCLKKEQKFAKHSNNIRNNFKWDFMKFERIKQPNLCYILGFLYGYYYFNTQIS